jgi:hypothetical protein
MNEALGSIRSTEKGMMDNCSSEFLNKESLVFFLKFCYALLILNM